MKRPFPAILAIVYFLITATSQTCHAGTRIKLVTASPKGAKKTVAASAPKAQNTGKIAAGTACDAANGTGKSRP